MLSCSGCKRFLHANAHVCPFCGVTRATQLAPRSLPLFLGVTVAACGPAVATDGDGTGDAGASTDTTIGSGPNTTATGTTIGTSPSTSADTTMATSPSSSTGTSNTTGDDDDSNDQGGAFYGGAPDGGGLDIECDVWAQDCPLGSKCMPWNNRGEVGWNATKCAPLAPFPAGIGEVCTVEGGPFSGIDSCGLGEMCWDVDPETLEGRCVANCAGSEAAPQCSDATTQCLIGYDGTLHVCIPVCDPLLQDCAPWASCLPVGDAFFCVPDASGAGGQYAEPCLRFDDCDRGLFCAEVEGVPGCMGTGCCAEFCDLAAPDPNALCSGAGDGAQCLPWFPDDEAPIGWENVGACLIPA